MVGTYNEVQVKKLGQKKAKKAKKKPGVAVPTDPGPNQQANNHTNHQNSQLNPLQTLSNGPRGPHDSQQAASWPPSLQDFVNRSFAQAESLSPQEKALFNEQIQAMVFSAARDHKIWTNDWTKQRLPIFDPSVLLCLYQDTVEAMDNAQYMAQHVANVNVHKGVVKKGQNVQNVQNVQSPLNVKNLPNIPSVPAVSTTPSIPNPNHPNVSTVGSKTYDSGERKRQRAARFQPPSQTSNSQPSSSSNSRKSAQIIGTLEALEKRYLRLTSEPDPALVRPKHVLERCLGFVVDKYRSTGGLYLYINDQLKAIRQDMTVQHIKGDLAIKVYETHGRIAIENNDLGEFNQCQAQLKHLYAANSDPAWYKNTYEFTCYRVLYLLLTGNYADINLTRLELLHADRSTKELDLDGDFPVRRQCVYKALELSNIVALGDYHGFFTVFKWFQTIGCMKEAFHLLNQFMANKQRVIALNTMCKAFKKLPLSMVLAELALDTDTQFFADFGLLGFVTEADFDCASARAVLQATVDQGTFKKVDIKGQV